VVYCYLFRKTSGAATLIDKSQQANELDRLKESVRLLNSGPADFVITADHGDMVRVALIEFDYEWRGDHWWTAFGEFRTLGELRKISARIMRGEWP